MCVNGLVNLAITSIERRFGLKSAYSGLIVSSYDIGSLAAIIPITYLGGRAGASKPLWIGAGLCVMGLGSFVWTLPHFMTGVYMGNGTEEVDKLCLDIGGHFGMNCEHLTSYHQESLVNYRWDKVWNVIQAPITR